MTLRSKDIIRILPRLRRYALVLTRHSHDAEDLVQDSLLRAHERPPALRGQSPTAWAMSVLHNAFVDQARKRSSTAKREAAFASLMPQFVDAPQERTVRLNQLLRAFMDLPLEQREALHLVAIEGHSYAEAAGILDIPLGTLMSRLGRARAALRALEEQRPHLQVVRKR